MRQASNADARSTAIQSLEVAGTRGSSTFYRMAELAASVAGAPYAAITVIDRDTRWFYSAIGLRVEKTPLHGSVCSLTLEHFTPTVFTDIEDDPRFPGRVVDGAPLEPMLPWMRFYAGVPIIYEGGVSIGTLFLADEKPREISAALLYNLQGIAESVVDSFRLVASTLKQQREAMDAHHQRMLLEQSHRELVRAQKYTDLAAKLSKIGFWSYSLQDGAFKGSGSLDKVLPLRDGDATLDSFIGTFDAEAQEALRGSIDVSVRSGDSFEMQLPMKRENARKKRWLRITGQVDQEAGKAKRLYGCVQDVTSAIENRTSVFKLAMLDTLTGVYNRRFIPVAFMKTLRSIQSKHQKIGLLLIDLDHFKFANDTKGHGEGDRILLQVARILREELRERDIAGRIGGDEFLAIATGPADSDFVAELADRLVRRARANPLMRDNSLPVTFSVGYTEITNPDAHFADALKEADLAVYEAKARGRNTSAAYSAKLGEQTYRRDEVLSQIDKALKTGDIVPAYQAKIDLQTGRICGVEALCRWRAEDGALRTPGAFIEALEDINYCRRLSDRVMELAIRDMARLLRAGGDCGRLSVNVAESQLIDAGFIDRATGLLNSHGLPYERFEIEITESALLTRMTDKIKQTLRAVRELGARVSFDDFGTGYASLMHLREFDINTIKIDKSFVMNLTDDPAAQTITASMIQMANNLDIEVVAEGVEDRGAEAMLRHWGCQIGQGFLYSKPIPFDDFADLVLRTPNFVDWDATVGA